VSGVEMDQSGAFGADWSAGLRRGADRELDDWLRFAHAAADEADRIALAAFQTELQIDQKTDGSYVTEADRSVERMLRERIADRYPGHGVIGEEYGRDDADGARERWYVDPIDGTHNFMRGVPLFGTLLAIEADGELQVGLASAPALGQRWYARRGGGTWVTGGPNGTAGPRRLRVSKVDRLDQAQILFRSINDMHDSRVGPGFDRLVREVWRERGFGDFWGYTLVADGAAEAMMEQDLGPWDLAAPWILVEEAGGRITDFDGRRSLARGEGFATNGLLHEAVLAHLRG
jgi:histidinol-phosphatase